MTIERIFEDNHHLVVEKPINMPVQADASGDPDLLSELKEYIKVTYHKPGNVYLGLVHRLDRPTGGLMVFAKTSKAASRLSDMMRRRAVERRYYAVICGTQLPQSGTFTDYLVKDRRHNRVHLCDAQTAGAKQAVLHYTVVERQPPLTLVSVQLETGRSHQVRVQWANRGFPLWGDHKYGSRVNKPGRHLALYAWSLSFDHITTGEQLTFSKMPPQTNPWTAFNTFY